MLVVGSGARGPQRVLGLRPADVGGAQFGVGGVSRRMSVLELISVVPKAHMQMEDVCLSKSLRWSIANWADVHR